MRTSKSEVTGFTQFFMNFGREHVISGGHYKAESMEKIVDGVESTQGVVKRQEGYQKTFRQMTCQDSPKKCKELQSKKGCELCSEPEGVEKEESPVRCRETL